MNHCFAEIPTSKFYSKVTLLFVRSIYLTNETNNISFVYVMHKNVTMIYLHLQCNYMGIFCLRANYKVGKVNTSQVVIYTIPIPLLRRLKEI